MIPQEIPATEQLMGIATEPAVSRDMRFAFQGLIWPDPEALKAQSAKSALTNVKLVNDTVGWIEAILRPAWVAPDLRRRLLAARAINAGQDAFLTRYAINGQKIQIIVTRFHVHVVIAPVSAPPRKALHEYLNVDRPDDPTPWTGDLWQTSQVAGLDYGAASRMNVMDWRDTIYYLANRQSVMFSLEKAPERPRGSNPPKSPWEPSEQAERDWFGNP